ncbi:hypothetical protein M9458_013425, partial [Cirrhinus mrigala]
MQRTSFLSMELESVKQTARLTQERAQSVLNFSNMFKSRMAYGSCSGALAPGAASYETASSLATRKSPEVGVAVRHSPGLSHTSLPLNPHRV